MPDCLNGKLAMNDDKRIPIQDKATGAIRFSEPVRRNVPSESIPLTEMASSSPPPVAEQIVAVKLDQSNKVESIAGEALGTEGANPKAKSKQEISTFEQFLFHAYGLKGRRVALKKKVLQDISPNLSIPVEGLVELQKLVNADRQFCVPRQILLASREIEGYPLIKEALRKFVMEVMLSHPAFKNPKVTSAIRNLENAPLPHAALKLVMEEVFEKAELEEKPGEKKDGEKTAKKLVAAEEMKINATNCLAVWFAVTRNLALEDVADALNVAVWTPAGYGADSDIAKLRALTSIEKVEGVGLACEQYKRRAVAQADEAVRASAEAARLRTEHQETQLELEQIRSELDETKNALEKLQLKTTEEIATLHQSAETQAAHLRDDFEQLRSRVLRRLVENVEKLGIGLSAIQGSEPKVHVVRDRLERVIDELQKEINKLREG